MKLVLASASPRRKELLAHLGYSFTITPADINEDVLPGEDPVDYVRRISREKCVEVSRKESQKIVLSADTTVVLADKILGKPRDADDAIKMLEDLSGKRHRVYTSFSLYSPKTLEIETSIVETIVEFRELTLAEIKSYVATGDAMDKAGSYGFQNGAIAFISEIQGSPSNVIGLPLSEVSTALKKFF